jgi:hypothetical protein
MRSALLIQPHLLHHRRNQQSIAVYSWSCRLHRDSRPVGLNSVWSENIKRSAFIGVNTSGTGVS